MKTCPGCGTPIKSEKSSRCHRFQCRFDVFGTREGQLCANGILISSCYQPHCKGCKTKHPSVGEYCNYCTNRFEMELKTRTPVPQIQVRSVGEDEPLGAW